MTNPEQFNPEEEQEEKQNNKIIEDLKEKKSRLFDLDFEKINEINDKIVKKSEDLKNKYPDCEDYRLYHLLIGSTLTEKIANKFDFPDEDSAEAFINKLCKEYLGENK